MVAELTVLVLALLLVLPEPPVFSGEQTLKCVVGHHDDEVIDLSVQRILRMDELCNVLHAAFNDSESVGLDGVRNEVDTDSFESGAISEGFDEGLVEHVVLEVQDELLE